MVSAARWVSEAHEVKHVESTWWYVVVHAKLGLLREGDGAHTEEEPRRRRVQQGAPD